MPAWSAAAIAAGPLLHFAVHERAAVIDAAAYSVMAIGLAGAAVTLLRGTGPSADRLARRSPSPAPALAHGDGVARR